MLHRCTLIDEISRYQTFLVRATLSTDLMRSPIDRLKGHLQWHVLHARRRLEALWSERTLFNLKLRNVFSLRSILNSDGPVVSLTSYGKRLGTVHLTIESIGRGRRKPSRLILWLDDHQALLNPPKTLRRLTKRGLEILPTENYRSHKKYLPYVLGCQTFEKPLVTADDDVVYPTDWLSDLTTAYEENGDVINCFRARRIEVENGNLLPFASWPFCNTKNASFRNFSEGVGGVIFPPSYLYKLKLDGIGFMTTCPQHDDVWLNVIALRNGFRVRQVTTKAAEFPSIPDTQDEGLWVTNLGPDGNRQIRETYNSSDLIRLESESQATH